MTFKPKIKTLLVLLIFISTIFFALFINNYKKNVRTNSVQANFYNIDRTKTVTSLGKIEGDVILDATFLKKNYFLQDSTPRTISEVLKNEHDKNFPENNLYDLIQFIVLDNADSPKKLFVKNFYDRSTIVIAGNISRKKYSIYNICTATNKIFECILLTDTTKAIFSPNENYYLKIPDQQKFVFNICQKNEIKVNGKCVSKFTSQTSSSLSRTITCDESKKPQNAVWTNNISSVTQNCVNQDFNDNCLLWNPENILYEFSAISNDGKKCRYKCLDNFTLDSVNHKCIPSNLSQTATCTSKPVKSSWLDQSSGNSPQITQKCIEYDSVNDTCTKWFPSTEPVYTTEDKTEYDQCYFKCDENYYFDGNDTCFTCDYGYYYDDFQCKKNLCDFSGTDLFGACFFDYQPSCTNLPDNAVWLFNKDFYSGEHEPEAIHEDNAQENSECVFTCDQNSKYIDGHCRKKCTGLKNVNWVTETYTESLEECKYQCLPGYEIQPIKYTCGAWENIVGLNTAVNTCSLFNYEKDDHGNYLYKSLIGNSCLETQSGWGWIWLQQQKRTCLVSEYGTCKKIESIFSVDESGANKNYKSTDVDLVTSNFTIEAYFYLDDYGPAYYGGKNFGYGTIFDKGSILLRTYNEGMGCGWQMKSFLLDLSTVGSIKTGVSVSSPKNSAVLNKWTHLVITYDGSNAKIYLNGDSVQVNRTTTEDDCGNVFSDYVNGSLNPHDNKNIFIGNNSTGDRAFGGKIKKINFYNQVLSEKNIKYLYENREN